MHLFGQVRSGPLHVFGLAAIFAPGSGDVTAATVSLWVVRHRSNGGNQGVMSMADYKADWESLAFLVPPGELGDWRMVLLYDAAVEAGLVDGLPASPAALADRLGVEEHAARVVLDGLAVWGIVVVGSDGDYVLGPAAPGPDVAAVLRHHARAIRGWSTIPDRLRGEPPSRAGQDIGAVEIMLDALAVMGRASAPGAVDACLARAPGARSVLDLGGGHGQFALEFARRGLRVIMQDRAEVIEMAQRKGWLAGSAVELFAGDLFETLPSDKFDLVFCAGVVYTFSAERNVALFRQVRSLISAGGILALHTFLGGTDDLATLFSAQMLRVPGGESHGEDDFRRWLDQTGYHSVGSQRLERRPEWLMFASPGNG